jgi:membrane protease YdiL (CAAX protease family)
MSLLKVEENETEYITVGRRFAGYKWYKPVFVGALMLLFFFIFSVVDLLLATAVAAMRGWNPFEFLSSMQASYDAFDVYTPEGVIARLGGVAIFIPALLIAAIIVKDRPFSSYASVKGGWNLKILCAGLAVGLIVSAAPNAIVTIVNTAERGEVSFTAIGLVFLLIMTPLQCIAEEYIFRGLIMQTFGGWFNSPIIGIVLQAVVFALMHPYSLLGVVTIAVSGLCLGVITYYSKGIEMSAAFHICNNLSSFILTGIGFGAIATEVAVSDAVFSMVSNILFMVATIILDKKFHFFDRRQKG